jgi:peptide/nickel transport system permease protein
MTSARTNYEGLQYVLDVAKHMILPMATLIIVLIPEYFRIGKSSMLQALNEEYVVILRATGMSSRRIYGKYVFRNAILPTVTLLGIEMAYLITGVTLIEIVFAWPGMGRLVMTAITQRDYPTLMGIYLVMSICVAVVMLVIDLLYAVLDPRIRYE